MEVCRTFSAHNGHFVGQYVQQTSVTWFQKRFVGRAITVVAAPILRDINISTTFVGQSCPLLYGRAIDWVEQRIFLAHLRDRGKHIFSLIITLTTLRLLLGGY